MKIFLENEVVEEYDDIYMDITPEMMQELINDSQSLEDVKAAMSIILLYCCELSCSISNGSPVLIERRKVENLLHKKINV